MINLQFVKCFVVLIGTCWPHPWIQTPLSHHRVNLMQHPIQLQSHQGMEISPSIGWIKWEGMGTSWALKEQQLQLSNISLPSVHSVTPCWMGPDGWCAMPLWWGWICEGFKIMKCVAHMVQSSLYDHSFLIVERGLYPPLNGNLVCWHPFPLFIFGR